MGTPALRERSVKRGYCTIDLRFRIAFNLNTNFLTQDFRAWLSLAATRFQKVPLIQLLFLNRGHNITSVNLRRARGVSSCPHVRFAFANRSLEDLYQKVALVFRKDCLPGWLGVCDPVSWEKLVFNREEWRRQDFLMRGRGREKAFKRFGEARYWLKPMRGVE